MTDSGPASLVELRFAQAVKADPNRACEVFDETRIGWLGSPADSPKAGVRRYLTDLSLPVRSGAPHLVFKKAAFVDVGAVIASDQRCEIEISWRSATMAPLFPVFAGRLVVSPSEARLEGYYAPPGGDIGLVLDKAFLNIAARGTGRWFLERVIHVIEAEAGPAEPTVEDAGGTTKRSGAV